MLAYRATYKLSNDNGSTTYTSKPFSSKEEAKENLYEELDMLEYDDELKHMTYCNVIEKVLEKPSPQSQRKFPEPLHTFLDKMFKEAAIKPATKPIEDKEPKTPSPTDMEQVISALTNLGYEVKAVKEDDTNEYHKTLTVKAIKEHDYCNPLGIKLEYSKGIKDVDIMSLDEFERASKAHKTKSTDHKAPSCDEALHRKTCGQASDYIDQELLAMLNHDGKKKPKKS